MDSSTQHNPTDSASFTAVDADKNDVNLNKDNTISLSPELKCSNDCKIFSDVDGDKINSSLNKESTMNSSTEQECSHKSESAAFQKEEDNLNSDKGIVQENPSSSVDGKDIVQRKSVKHEYRDESPSSEDESVFISSNSSSSSCSSLSSLSNDEQSVDKMDEKARVKRQPKVMRTKGELLLEDLPNIQYLNIKVPEEDMKLIGKVSGIVEQLVVIESFKDSTPLNLDSVLFLSSGVALGHVFDVFGPVVQPLYAVRFNSAEDVKNKGVVIGDNVYFAPDYADYTSYVFLESLKQIKGSDASWEDNNEPPVENLDYSDDEKEKAARPKAAAKRRKAQRSSSLSSTNNRSALPQKNDAKKESKTMNNQSNVSLKDNYFRNVFSRTQDCKTASKSVWNRPFVSSSHSTSYNSFQPLHFNSDREERNFTPPVHMPPPSTMQSPTVRIPAVSHPPLTNSPVRSMLIQPSNFSPQQPVNAFYNVAPSTVRQPTGMWIQPPPIFTLHTSTPPPGFYGNPLPSSTQNMQPASLVTQHATVNHYAQPVSPMASHVQQAAPMAQHAQQAAPMSQYVQPAPAMTQYGQPAASMAQFVQPALPMTQYLQPAASMDQHVPPVAPTTQHVQQSMGMGQHSKSIPSMTQPGQSIAPMVQSVRLAVPSGAGMPRFPIAFTQQPAVSNSNYSMHRPIQYLQATSATGVNGTYRQTPSSAAIPQHPGPPFPWTSN